MTGEGALDPLGVPTRGPNGTAKVDPPGPAVLAAACAHAWDAVLITEAAPVDAASHGPRIVYVNDAFTRMTGYAAADVLGRTPRLMQSADTDRAALDRIGRSLRNWEPIEVELLNVRADGSPFWVRLGIKPLADDSGRYTHWISVQRETTGRRRDADQVEQELRTARGHMWSAFGDAPIGMAIATPVGELLRVNTALCDLLGRTETQLVGGDLFSLTHPEDLPAAQLACASLATPDGGTRVQVGCRFRHADGHHLFAQVTTSAVLDGSGAPKHLVMHVEDTSAQVELQQRITYQAMHDPLTGLPNRALFADRLEHSLGRARRDGSCVSVLFCDLDNFKAVNDSLGHGAGDQVLSAIALRLSALLRPGDTAARLGGDEFTVLCVDTGLEQAEDVAQRLLDAVALPVVCEGGETVRLSASIGVLSTDASEADAASLLRDADAAMYAAKARGRAQYAAFRSEMRSDVLTRRSTETELRNAIANGEFELHYQPVVDLASGRVQAHEALLRWRHPERGLLLPHQFIPVAEETGLLQPIGDWVLDEAAAQASRWRAGGATTWMNISARQLTPELVPRLEQLVARHQLAPAALGLELTESVLVRDLPAAHPLLAQIRRLGIRLAIDDFGTGYSSLAYLAELPIDAVKVDQRFTAQLGSGGKGAAVISAVLALATSLGISTVVVEGVENAAQLTELQGLGVATVQGHYFGAAAPAAACHPAGTRVVR